MRIFKHSGFVFIVILSFILSGCTIQIGQPSTEGSILNDDKTFEREGKVKLKDDEKPAETSQTITMSQDFSNVDMNTFNYNMLYEDHFVLTNDFLYNVYPYLDFSVIDMTQLNYSLQSFIYMDYGLYDFSEYNVYDIDYSSYGFNEDLDWDYIDQLWEEDNHELDDYYFDYDNDEFLYDEELNELEYDLFDDETDESVFEGVNVEYSEEDYYEDFAEYDYEDEFEYDYEDEFYEEDEEYYEFDEDIDEDEWDWE
ncbi:hypothetical protein MKX54_06875 [Alkalihalobacillus sp. FSL R5-0424]